MTPIFPLMVNILVIGVIAAELIATVMGAIDANQLLIVSAISGGLTIFSMKLSQQALESLKQVNSSEEAQLQQEIDALAHHRKHGAAELLEPRS